VVAAYFCDRNFIHQHEQAKSGSSVAVPVAAGITANMLDYLYQITDLPEGKENRILIRKLFLAMSAATKSCDYRNLVPWELFKHGMEENRQRIMQILNEDPGMYYIPRIY
jgi:hypothetical protein